MAPTRWNEEELRRASDFWPARLLLESAALDVYGQLADDRLTAAALAERLSLDPRATEIFLDALVGLELLEKGGSRYSNSAAAARYLVPGSQDYLGHKLIAAYES